MTKLQNCFYSLSKQECYKDLHMKSCKKKKNIYTHRCLNIKKFLNYDKYNKMKNCYQYINLKKVLMDNSKNYKNNNDNNNGNNININEVNVNNVRIFINNLFNDCFITSMYIFEHISLIGWSNGIISIFDKYLNIILNKKISNSTIKNISMNKKENAMCFMDNLHNLYLIYLNIRNDLKENNNNFFFDSKNENCNAYQNKFGESYYFDEEKYINLNKREQSFIKAFVCNKIFHYNIKYLNSCIINPFFDSYHNNNICILSSNKAVSILYIYEFHINSTIIFKEQNILNFYWYHCYIFICTECSIFVINFFDKTKVAQIFLDSYNDLKIDSLVQINQPYINRKIKEKEGKCNNDITFTDKRISSIDNTREYYKNELIHGELHKGKLECDSTESEYNHLLCNKKKEKNLFLIHTCATQKGVYIIAKEKNIKIIKIEKINGIEKVSVLSNFYLDNYIISLCAFHDNNNYNEEEFFISAIIFNVKVFKENEGKLKIRNCFLEHQILTNKNSLIYRNTIKIKKKNYINMNNIICNYNNDTTNNIYNGNENYTYFKNYINYLRIFQYTSFSKNICNDSVEKKKNYFNDVSLYIYGYNTFLQFRPKNIKESFFELILENKRNSKNILVILNNLKKNTNKKELTDIGLLLICSFFKFKKYFLATKIFLILHKRFHNKRKVIYDIIKILFLHKKVYILSLFYTRLKKKEKGTKTMYYKIRYRIRKRKKKKIKSIIYLFHLIHKIYENKLKEKTKAKLRKNKKKKKILRVQKETKRKKKFSFFITKKLFNKFLVFLLCTNVYHFKNIYETSSDSDLNAHLLCKNIIFLLKDDFEFINKKLRTTYNSFHFTLHKEKKKNSPSDISFKKNETEKKILLDILLDIYFKFNICPFNIYNKNNLILFNERNEKCKKIEAIGNFLNQNECSKKTKLSEKEYCGNILFHHEYINKNKISKNMIYTCSEKTYINIERNSYNEKKKNKKFEEFKNEKEFEKIEIFRNEQKRKFEKKEIVINEEKKFQNEMACSNNNFRSNDMINGSLYNCSFFKKEYDNIKKAEILKILLNMKNEKVFIYLKQCDLKLFKKIINKNIMKLCKLNIKKTIRLLIIKKENKCEYFFDPHQIVKKLKKKPFFLYNFLREIKDIKYVIIYINLILYLMFIFEPLLLINFLRVYYKYISFKKILFFISFFNYLFASYSFLGNKNSYCNNSDRTNNKRVTICENDNYLEENGNIITENSNSENKIMCKIYKKDKCVNEKENNLIETYSLTNIYNRNFIKNHNLKRTFDSKSYINFFKNENVILLYKYLLNEYVKKKKLVELFNMIKEESINYKNKLNFFLNLKAFIYLKFGYVNRAIKIYLKLSNYLQIFLIMNYHNLNIDEDIRKKVKDYLDAGNHVISYNNLQKKNLNKKLFDKNFFKEQEIKKNNSLFIKDEYFCYIDENKEIKKYRSIILRKKKFSLKRKCKIHKLQDDVYCFRENVYFSRKRNKIHHNDTFVKMKKDKNKKIENNEITKYAIHNIFHAETSKNNEMIYKMNNNLEKYIIKNVNCNILDKEIMYQLYLEKKRKKKKINIYLSSENRQIFKKNNNDIRKKNEENQYLNKEIVIKNYFIHNINYEMNYLTLISLLEELLYKNELYENYNKILRNKKKSIFNFLSEIKRKGYTIYNGKEKKELKRYELNLIDINDYYFLNEDTKESCMLTSYFRNDQHVKNNEKIYHIQKNIPPNYYLYDQMYSNPFISKISSFCSLCLNNIYIDRYYFNKKKIKNNIIIFFFCNHVYHFNCLKKKQITCNICY
ncbi:conserved Plasmodium protein, unknown function [Plasmodium relictum]|uniref:RING-type domain-containing protein n=1 Tax=Plasmodium relictum TaxID=85471 RepID=A0A1J1H3S8_PLARL|nr:conserved Plasmodium protein, unknown function [Plasmodium relictum]CRG99375.1 conserved Plasmodium protein, unknown function [Plasmodium relictum]